MTAKTTRKGDEVTLHLNPKLWTIMVTVVTALVTLTLYISSKVDEVEYKQGMKDMAEAVSALASEVDRLEDLVTEHQAQTGMGSIHERRYSPRFEFNGKVNEKQHYGTR